MSSLLIHSVQTFWSVHPQHKARQHHSLDAVMLHSAASPSSFSRHFLPSPKAPFLHLLQQSYGESLQSAAHLHIYNRPLCNQNWHKASADSKLKSKQHLRCLSVGKANSERDVLLSSFRFCAHFRVRNRFVMFCQSSRHLRCAVRNKRMRGSSCAPKMRAFRVEGSKETEGFRAQAGFMASSTGDAIIVRDDLLGLIVAEERGLRTQKDVAKRASIVRVIDALTELGANSITTDSKLSGTWRMLWTTEKEQLFIIEKAPLFGTQVGDNLQVIDVASGTLNNIITFPPLGAFVVGSTIEVVSKKRVNFRFRSAVLYSENWRLPLPPFGQGWFETVYIDEKIRVAKDIRGDYLVVDRAPYKLEELLPPNQ